MLSLFGDTLLRSEFEWYFEEIGVAELLCFSKSILLGIKFCLTGQDLP